MKRDYRILVQIAEKKNLRDTLALKSCSDEVAQIKDQISFLRQLDDQTSQYRSPQQNHTVITAWLSWRNTRIAELNLKLFDASASLEQHKDRTRKSFGKAMAYKRVFERMKN